MILGVGSSGSLGFLGSIGLGGFRVKEVIIGSELMVQGSGFTVQGSGFTV